MNVLFTLLAIAAVAGVVYVLYHVALELYHKAVYSWWPAITSYAEASWNDLLDGMTAWGWVGFGLSVVIGMAIGLGIAWPSGRALAAVEVRRLKRQLDQARKEIDHEREKARQAEQAAAQDREAAKRAESSQAHAERIAEGLQGQLDKAVRLADDRGRQLKEIRQKNRQNRPPKG